MFKAGDDRKMFEKLSSRRVRILNFMALRRRSLAESFMFYEGETDLWKYLNGRSHVTGSRERAIVASSQVNKLSKLMNLQSFSIAITLVQCIFLVGTCSDTMQF